MLAGRLIPRVAHRVDAHRDREHERLILARLDLERCTVFATPRVETVSKPEEVAADVDVQRLGGARIFVESTRPLVFGDNKMTPFLTNVSFDVAAIC